VHICSLDAANSPFCAWGTVWSSHATASTSGSRDSSRVPPPKRDEAAGAIRRPVSDPFLHDKDRAMNAVSHTTRRDRRCGPLHEAEVFLDAMIQSAVFGLTGDLAPTEALEQVVRLGGRVEAFLDIASVA
jgi:hypothetical protein